MLGLANRGPGNAPGGHGGAKRLECVRLAAAFKRSALSKAAASRAHSKRFAQWGWAWQFQAFSAGLGYLDT